MDINKIISNNIKKFRNRAGLTQKELADMLMTSPSTIQKWEKGINRVYSEYLFELCKIFGVKTEVMFMDSEKGLLSCYTKDGEYPDYFKYHAETVEYIGLDDVVNGLYNYCFEKKEALKINPEKDQEEEKHRVTHWEEDNSYFIAFNKNTGVIYGLRDYGRYYPIASEFAFVTDFIPISIDDYSVNESEGICKSNWKKEILSKKEYLSDRIPKELKRYHDETQETLKLLCITDYLDEGMYEAYDLNNQSYYSVIKFNSDNENFYYRNDDVSDAYYYSGQSVVKKADDSFGLFFPDKEVMRVMGINDIPDSFEAMGSRDDFSSEIIERYTIPDNELEDIYLKVIALLNICLYPFGDSEEYKELKADYEIITEHLKNKQSISDDVVDKTLVSLDNLYRKIKEKYK